MAIDSKSIDRIEKFAKLKSSVYINIKTDTLANVQVINSTTLNRPKHRCTDKDPSHPATPNNFVVSKLREDDGFTGWVQDKKPKNTAPQINF